MSHYLRVASAVVEAEQHSMESYTAVPYTYEECELRWLCNYSNDNLRYPKRLRNRGNIERAMVAYRLLKRQEFLNSILYDRFQC